jgi:hypothetical protein
MKYALIIAAICLSSCSSHSYVMKSRTQKYLNRKIENIQRQIVTDEQKQFIIVNNQIIIFENTNKI